MAIPAFVPLALMGASAAANAIRGIGQAKKAKGLEAEFQRLDKALTPVSPEQYAQLARTRQLERSMRLGTDPTSAMARQGLAGSLAQTQANLVRAGGGAGTVNALLRSQTGYGQGIGQVAAQAAQSANRMLAYQGGLIDNIQNAVYNLQMKRRNYAQALAAQQRQAATDSATAAIGAFANAATMIPGMNKSVPTDTLKTTTATNPATVAEMNAITPNYLKSVTPTVNQQIIPRAQQSIAQDVGPVTGVSGPTGAALQNVLDYRTSVQNWNAPYELGMQPQERIGF